MLLATQPVEILSIIDDVMAALPGDLTGQELAEAFTKIYVDMSRERYSTKNVIVHDKLALVGRTFDDFQESKTLDIGTDSIQYTCLIFNSGNFEYNGPKGVAHLRYAGSFEEKDENHVEFLEIKTDRCM
jgi:hypothetical protein